MKTFFYVFQTFYTLFITSKKIQISHFHEMNIKLCLSLCRKKLNFFMDKFNVKLNASRIT